MILITGASGTIGRALTKELRAAGVAMRAMSRDPEKAKSHLDGAIEVVRGDFNDATSLASALKGIDTVFLLTAPGPQVADHDAAMLRAVKGTRVAKIVKLSAFGADELTLKATEWHRPGERGVMDSGLAWTLLRPVAFASNALSWGPAIRAGAAIEVATGEGKQTVVDPRDVAAVAARVLTSRDHDGRAYALTGPEALSTPEQVALVGKVLGRPLAMEHVTPEIAVERMRSAGVPEAFVDAMLEGYTFVRAGKAEARSDAVERVLGRAPRSFETWAREHAAAFA